MMTDPTIVITSAVPWQGITARPQHFARGLASRGWHVLFVDGPITLIGPLKNHALRSRLFPSPAVHQIDVEGGHGSLHVLSPVAQLPFGNMVRAINRINQRVLAMQIKPILTGPVILLSMLPGSVDLAPHLHPLGVLYDCVDFHSEFPGLIDKALVNEMEADLVGMSRHIFTTADALYDRMAKLHSSVQLLPNAADTRHFATTSTLSSHPRLRGISEPRVAFVGGIGPWIDQEFLHGLAVKRPNVNFVMIGPIETDISRLKSLPNVHFLGRQPYAELPEYLAGCSATLVAFAQTALSQSVNPVKVYEYLAAGKEVISTPIRELNKLKDLVWIAADSSAGVEALDRILAGERKLHEKERLAFVENNSWSNRVSEIERSLRALLPQQ